MGTPLLTTKLYVPPVRPELVPRPRLIKRLHEGLHRKLTLISAPAGFGKTTLLSEWVQGGGRPVAWLSLDNGDNDPVQFLNYLIAALQQVDEGIGRTVRDILQSPQLPPAGNLVTLLINDITASAIALTLVLDDYHLITADSVHQIVQFLLENQPPSMHLAIGTRQDPRLPLPRLRARSQVTEIRERDLRFTTEEATAFLDQTMGLPLSPGAVQALESRTEGWIAGLQLAALALKEDPEDAEAFIAAFTGDDRYIVEYLVAEVLQRQPQATRDFLRQTAILDRLTASLCNAVTGREGSQMILDQLAGSNLFLIPLDRRREWYRYHRLFAEALRTTLTEEEQELLHRRAGRWYETHGFMSQAIQHALASVPVPGDASAGHYAELVEASGPALDDAERLIQLAAEETIFGGSLLTVRGWLDALPDERVRANGELATYKGWVLALTGDIALAEEYADAAEARLRQTSSEPAEEPAMGLGKLLALRSFLAVFSHQDYEEAIELAGGALQVLKEDQTHWRVIALWLLAESQERTSNITEAITTLREARRTGRTHGTQIFAAMVELFLAAALQAHGRRQEAMGVCEEAIEQYTDQMGRASPVAGLIFSRLGTLHYEANQLELALKYLDQGQALSEQLALGSSITFSLGFSALTLHAQGKTGAALEALQKAYQFAARTGLADADWCLALEANIHLRQGDLPFALRWAEVAGLSPDEAPHYLRMEQHLVYARLLLAQGRLSDCRRWLARLEQFTRERGLIRWLLTVHILQALTAERSGDASVARNRFSQALEIAAPEGYFRAFLDEDARIIGLLPDVRPVAPAFVDQLLGYAGIPVPKPDITSQLLVEPLSERELEVLRLIAAGLSNRGIAQELIIAIGTAKRHINNIYGKLGVHSRTAAIAKARELRLLE
ncbi:MAG: hypothetical protein GXP37_15100 [Chloroflexi bacterium]|nr:hypothetical protein [Chloroflexota bacterium]